METLSSNETERIFISAEGKFYICVRGGHKRVDSNGSYFGNNPFDYVLPTTLFQIIVIILMSRLLYIILRPLRTPKLVCSALAGIILGPSVLGQLTPFTIQIYPPIQAEFLLTGASVGTIYYLFLISMKMDISTTLRTAKKTWRFGVLPTIFCFAVMTCILNLYSSHKHEGLEAIYNQLFLFTSATSLTSFAVISDALMELNLITSELGQIALSSAMLNDVMLWGLMIVTNLLKTKAIKDSIYFFSICCGLLIFCICILRPILQKLSRSTPIGKPVNELNIVMILVGVLAMSAITDSIGLSFLQGPLLFGLIMPNGPPLGTTIIERTENIVSLLFMPLFFAYVGLNTNVTKIKHWEMVGEFQCILVAGYMAKLLGCMLVSRTYNIKLKQGIVLGLILNLKGVMELVVLLRFKKIKLFSFEILSLSVIFFLGTTSIAFPLIEFLYKPHARLEKSTRHGGQSQTIQNSPKNSEFCIISCIHSEANVHCTIALLEASNPNESSPICVYVTHLIELVGGSTPVLIPYDKNSRKSKITTNTKHIMRAFENYSRNSHGPVIFLPYVNIAPYKNMHVSMCNLIQDKSVSFLLLPFHQNNMTPDGCGSNASAIRDLNAELQASARCTVGILVDKNSRPNTVASEFCFHVGIFFIGGADDREALALALRMSDHEDVSISLFLFLLKNRNLGMSEDEMPEDDMNERMLDEDLIDEFKAKSIGNYNVDMQEIEVEDGIQVLEAIRVLQGNYDLVMVGKQHDIGALKDLEMSEFMENAKMLGIFGDMLASNEFCDGMVNVLVMQCGGRRERDLQKTGSSVSQGSFGLNY